MFQFSCCDLKNILTVITSRMYILTTIKLYLFLDSNIVKCDVIKIKGVIMNIIQNSVQAIKARGQIIITLKEINNNVEIAIFYSGNRVPEEKL